MEAIRQAEAKLTVYVHPSNAADVRRAVARQLSTLLFSYEDRFDGVLLAHEFQVEGHKAKIMDGLVPYFGVPVHASMLLFSPQPGMILAATYYVALEYANIPCSSRDFYTFHIFSEGKVEMLGKESIHAIVLGVFSVAIMSDDITDRFKFKRKRDGGKFISKSDKGHEIKRGSMIRFSVKRVDTEMNCHITGSLVTPHTGSMLWLSVHDAKYAEEINNSGKRKSRDVDIKIEQNVQDHTAVNNEDTVINSERPRKSRKRNDDTI